MIRYHIAEFRNSELSAAFISRLNSDFEIARKAGFKLIPRFAYNWPMGGPDASVEIVLKHIEQLKPVFTQNVDVIHVVEFGLIGCWGEQHHSCNGLVDGMWEPNDKTWQIHSSLFQAVPTERMIMVRYPFWKFRYYRSRHIRYTYLPHAGIGSIYRQHKIALGTHGRLPGLRRVERGNME